MVVIFLIIHSISFYREAVQLTQMVPLLMRILTDAVIIQLMAIIHPILDKAQIFHRLTEKEDERLILK